MTRRRSAPSGRRSARDTGRAGRGSWSDQGWERSDRLGGARGADSAPAAPTRGRRGVLVARLLGAVGMVALTVALFHLVTDEDFRVLAGQVEVRGVRYADAGAVRQRLAELEEQPNIFRIHASGLAQSIAELPEVLSAEVRVSLPDRVEVNVHEREPIFVLRYSQEAQDAWLVDATGTLFAPVGAATAEELGSGATGTALPAVEDARLLDEPPGLGQRLGVEDLAVLRQLLGLTPERVGSSREELFLRIDERFGYVLEVPGRWWAVFGHYTPTARPPGIVPRQVQCLRALLARREPEVGRVILALSPSSCGTYLPATLRGSRRDGGGSRGSGEPQRTPRPRSTPDAP